MANKIRKVEYFYCTVQDEPGEVIQITFIISGCWC